MKTPNTSSNRQILQTKYKNARSNLLLVLVFTAINIVLLVAKSDVYFLFSAYIPYAFVTIGMAICGMLPSDYYVEELAGLEFLPTSVFVVFLGVALVITAMYLISWIGSKNNKSGWLIFALVLFAIDTVLMLLSGIQLEGIIDIAFHIWVIVSLLMGINACSKFKKLPPEELETAEGLPETEVTEQNSEDVANSNVIRIADPDAKARVLLEAEALGHTVTYRRVKRINELVIDGNVYDELEALIETAHSLKAKIDGHLIEVGFDGGVRSYLKVDGQTTAKKTRLY